MRSRGHCRSSLREEIFKIYFRIRIQRKHVVWCLYDCSNVLNTSDFFRYITFCFITVSTFKKSRKRRIEIFFQPVVVLFAKNHTVSVVRRSKPFFFFESKDSSLHSVFKIGILLLESVRPSPAVRRSFEVVSTGGFLDSERSDRVTFFRLVPRDLRESPTLADRL